METEVCKVLVVDDYPDAAESAALLLRMHGHDVRTAHRADDALRRTIEFQPDVVLMDIGLPGKDGFQLGVEIQAICPECRIVALTGFTHTDIAKRSAKTGSPTT